MALNLTIGGQKIIFLDVDGPLLPIKLHYDPQNHFMLDVECDWVTNYSVRKNVKFDSVVCHIVAHLCSKHGARIVISSDWTKRNTFEQMCQILDSNGIPSEFLYESWKTTKNPIWDRGDEIEHWLTQHQGEVSSFLILDDDFTVCRESLEKHVVLIDEFDGITYEQIFVCLEVFGIVDYNDLVTK